MGFLSTLSLPLPVISKDTKDFTSAVVNKEDGEAYRMRDGTAIIRIKISKAQGADVSFLAETYKPGDFGPVHEHSNEDEMLFFHTGSGMVTLGENQYPVKAGSIVFVPKGVWHGWKNTGTENIDMFCSITPSGSTLFGICNPEPR